jgi:hypothetical protein
MIAEWFDGIFFISSLIECGFWAARKIINIKDVIRNSESFEMVFETETGLSSVLFSNDCLHYTPNEMRIYFQERGMLK